MFFSTSPSRRATGLKSLKHDNIASMGANRLPGDDNDRLIAIGVVERETGITKETLRMWERRYGSPQPVRSGTGERLYYQADIVELRLVKQLLDRGFRPGKLLGQTYAQLRALADSLAAPARLDRPPTGEPVDAALALIKQHRIAEFGEWLQQRLHENGLRGFVLDVARPLCNAVGTAWECGEFAVFEEHIVTEQLQLRLRGAIGALARPTGRLRVLLTTLPGEEHGLGLLMLEALLSIQGARCLSLGLQTPIADIVACCEAESFDIVALSFSSFFSSRRARVELRELRTALDRRVDLWAGGGAIARFSGRHRLEGISLMSELDDALKAVEARL